MTTGKKGARLFAYIAVSALPLFVLLVAIREFLQDLVFNWYTAIMLVALPCVVLSVSVLIVRSKWRTTLKKISCVAIAIIFAFVSLVGLFLGELVYIESCEGAEAIEEYQERVSRTSEVMAPVSTIDGFEKIEYYDILRSYAIFREDISVWICTYDDDEYPLKKQKWEEHYVFQTDAVILDEHVCEPTVTIDGYTFRMLSIEEEYYTSGGYWYPKNLMWIAANDQTNEMVYLSFGNTDLDYINSAEEFIVENCKWKYIR